MAELFWLLIMSIIVALAAAFVVLLVKKWGIAEWMQIHGDSITSRLFSCDLCMSFWAGFIITLAVMCFQDNSTLVFVPFLSTPITRMLV